MTSSERENQKKMECVCESCDATFDSYFKLKMHRLTHDDLKSFKCDVCDKSFAERQALAVHVECHRLSVKQSDHSQSSSTASEVKDKGSQQLAELQLQIKSAPSKELEKIHKCGTCSKSFETQRGLKSHEIRHQLHNFNCNRCDASYTKKDKLIEHIKTTHGLDNLILEQGKRNPSHSLHVKNFDGNETAGPSTVTEKEKPYQCDRCLLRFSRQDYLTKHQVVHTGAKPYQCSTCKRYFKQRENLGKHKCFYKCNKCDKVFTDPYSKNQHKFEHWNKDAYQCEMCGRLFTSKSSLQTHQLIHLGIKPYECKHCGKCFGQSSILVMHMRVHTGEKPHLCELCGKTFASPFELRIHHKRNHTSKMTEFQCSDCGLKFSSKYSLCGHLGKHRSNASFACDICGKTYHRKGNLIEHQKSHDQTLRMSKRSKRTSSKPPPASTTVHMEPSMIETYASTSDNIQDIASTSMGYPSIRRDTETEHLTMTRNEPVNVSNMLANIYQPTQDLYSGHDNEQPNISLPYPTGHYYQYPN
ncbi:uncharacterized protein LOC144357178 [Saccoglossus kowalevskii]